MYIYWPIPEFSVPVLIKLSLTKFKSVQTIQSTMKSRRHCVLLLAEHESQHEFHIADASANYLVHVYSVATRELLNKLDCW